MTNQKFKIALIQLNGCKDVDENIKQVSRLIDEAVSEGAQFILTPENTHLMELDSKEVFEKTYYENDDPSLANIRKLASALNIWILIGSIGIKIREDKLVNRSYLIDRKGEIKARYDKIHMFDVKLKNGQEYKESKNIQPGEVGAIVDFEYGRIGLSICYDLRFPKLYQEYAKNGVDFIAIPAAFTKLTGEAHWHTLLKARAIENGAFIFAPAQAGKHDCGRQTYGHSLIVSPWGKIISEAHIEKGVIYADIDKSEVNSARDKIPNIVNEREFKIVEF